MVFLSYGNKMNTEYKISEKNIKSKFNYFLIYFSYLSQNIPSLGLPSMRIEL